MISKEQIQTIAELITISPCDAIERLNAARDLETMPVTRGTLVQLLVRVNMAEGMNSAQAEIHARMHVDAAFIQWKSELS